MTLGQWMKIQANAKILTSLLKCCPEASQMSRYDQFRPRDQLVA